MSEIAPVKKTRKELLLEMYQMEQRINYYYNQTGGVETLRGELAKLQQEYEGRFCANTHDTPSGTRYRDQQVFAETVDLPEFVDPKDQRIRELEAELSKVTGLLSNEDAIEE